ncbi:choice-of-anchor D domain-containing protein [bacterium]|nr:choice-of-anchor D domain-containing protein [bacterium]
MYRNYSLRNLLTAAILLFVISQTAFSQQSSPLSISPWAILHTSAPVGKSRDLHGAVTNSSQSTLRVLSGYFDSASGPFTLAEPLGARLEPGEDAELHLRFAPTDMSTVRQILHIIISRDTSVDTLDFEFSGTGTNLAPDVQFSPPSVRADERLINDTLLLEFLLTNFSPDTVRLDSIRIGGSHTYAFRVVTQSPDRLAPDAVDIVRVEALSAVPGERWCDLEVYLDGAYMQSAYIFVPWLPRDATLRPSANPLAFSDVMLTEEGEKILELHNDGTIPLEVTDVQLGGPDAAEFSIDPVGTFSIQPRKKVSIPIRFNPASLGSKSAWLSITSTDPAHPVTQVDFVARGVELRRPEIAVSKSNVNFGVVYIGYPETEIVTMYNRGKADLHITHIENLPFNTWEYTRCELSFLPALPVTIAAGDSLPLRITTNPSRLIFGYSRVLLYSDDPDTEALTITVGGISRYPAMYVPQPSQLRFEGIAVNDSADATLRIIDMGQQPSRPSLSGETIEGPDAAHFRVVDPLSDGAENNVKEVTIRYYQGDKGIRYAFFHVNGRGPITPSLDIPLIGFDGTSTSVQPAGLPRQPALSAWPNPFSSSTTVRLDLPQAGSAEVTLVDITGRTLLRQNIECIAAGEYLLPIDGALLPVGTYLLQLHWHNRQHTLRLLHLGR